ncbi:hypothetical protein OG601_02270 [Streptomyces sp. NBC_01239]|uniref:hypothetical protein n=1 Tax=Streptomyces sp. NBC_01239 TaxID=2903792 RepID=UPI0022579F52|nr:hypothetical protein [Streptomyces sp. NBC_01239]MCX4809448.1 hypothetical protein [Streptomyces sp. NBC_01239]
MLRIIDVRTGEPVEAAPARRGLTRVQAHASGLDATALRVLLVSDLLVRALELGGTPVWSLLTGDRQQAELRSAAGALGIRPFEDGTDLGSGLGEAQVLHVMAEGAGPAGRAQVSGTAGGTPASETTGRAQVSGTAGGTPASETTGRAQVPGTTEVTPASETTGRAVVAVAPVDSPTAAAPDLSDPGALRLALFSHPRDLPVRLDGEALDEARRTLAHWRGAVADWARRPSRPVPDEVRVELRTAWEDDLNVPEVLRVLHRVETWPDLPDGARFETYAYADRLLGLELTRDIGSLA